jgi:hypothetical protein
MNGRRVAAWAAGRAMGRPGSRRKRALDDAREVLYRLRWLRGQGAQ